MKTASIDMGDVARNMTLSIKVKGRLRFKFRQWLGIKLLLLGARVIGTQVDLSV